jgi:hypothetical protein
MRKRKAAGLVSGPLQATNGILNEHLRRALLDLRWRLPVLKRSRRCYLRAYIAGVSMCRSISWHKRHGKKGGKKRYKISRGSKRSLNPPTPAAGVEAQPSRSTGILSLAACVDKVLDLRGLLEFGSQLNSLSFSGGTQPAARLRLRRFCLSGYNTRNTILWIETSWSCQCS